MGLGRYAFSKRIESNRGVSSCNAFKIYSAVENREIDYTTLVLEQSQRLDHLAGMYYNDSTLWWIIGAASGIGWGLQVPPGTIIRIPTQPNIAIGLIA